MWWPWKANWTARSSNPHTYTTRHITTHRRAGFRYTYFSSHRTNKSSHRAFFCSFASFISDELTKKAGELRKGFLKATLHFVLRSLRFPRTITPNRPLKQGWMLKTSSSSQRMENDDLTAKARKSDQASHKVWLKAYLVHQYTSESERLLWTSSNVHSTDTAGTQLACAVMRTPKSHHSCRGIDMGRKETTSSG